MNRHKAVATAVVLVMVMTSGCGSAYREPPVTAPVPADAHFPAPTPAPQTKRPPKCDPRYSLPPSTTPPPGITKLRVGVDPTNPLISYRDPATGEYKGFMINLVMEIAKAMFPGENLRNKVVFVSIPFSDRVVRLNDHTIDIFAESMTATCQRATEVSYSTDYLDSGQGVLVKKDSSYRSLQDLAGKRVCSANGTVSIDHLRARPEKLVPVSAPSSSDCLVMLQQGQADALSTDEHSLLGIEQLDPQTRILSVPPSRQPGDQSCAWNKDPATCTWFSDEPHTFGFRKDSAGLVRFVNYVLDELRTNGRWQQIHDTWLKEHPDKGPPPPHYLSTTTWPY